MTAVAVLKSPVVDYAALSPLLALSGGLCLTLLLGVFRGLIGVTTVTPLSFETPIVISLKRGSAKTQPRGQLSGVDLGKAAPGD